ncbi:MAG: cyclic pyranopterin monophosphate synthase MoaC [Candidatus Bathyarchaeia archaeon]
MRPQGRQAQVSMIDITPKALIIREAVARGFLKLKPATIRLIREEKVEKGNPIETCKVAGILAAKNTSNVLPLCHPLPLTHVTVDVEINPKLVTVRSRVKAQAKTGVEMEALTATSVALLTIWDMVKQYEKDKFGQYPSTRISEILVEKKVKLKPI